VYIKSSVEITFLFSSFFFSPLHLFSYLNMYTSRIKCMRDDIVVNYYLIITTGSTFCTLCGTQLVVKKKVSWL